MKIILTLLLVFSLHLVQGQLSISFEPIPSLFDIDLPHAAWASDIIFGHDEPDRQCFDLFSPDTTVALPLIIYIHGGGFTSNSKSNYYNNRRGLENIQHFLHNGCAFVSLDYRLLQVGTETEGIRKPIGDVFYGLQYIRHHHSSLRIDPNKIVVYGSSAGAGSAILLGVSDDRANPSTMDPIARTSTRICAIGALSTQASYDFHRWSSDVFNNWDGQGSSMTMEQVRDQLGAQRLSMFYGGIDFEDFYTDSTIIAYREEMDFLDHCSMDDPPLFILNPSSAELPGDDFTHHSRHGKVLMEYAERAGMSVKADIPFQNINTTEGEDYVDFLVKKAKTCQLTTSTDMTKKLSSWKISPNPFEDVVQMEQLSGQPIDIFHISGKLVYHGPAQLIQSDSWIPGIYIFRMGEEYQLGIKR